MFGQPPIIIDCGSGTLKAGFATKEGQHGPTVEFPSIIGEKFVENFFTRRLKKIDSDSP